MRVFDFLLIVFGRFVPKIDAFPRQSSGSPANPRISNERFSYSSVDFPARFLNFTIEKVRLNHKLSIQTEFAPTTNLHDVRNPFIPPSKQASGGRPSSGNTMIWAPLRRARCAKCMYLSKFASMAWVGLGTARVRGMNGGGGGGGGVAGGGGGD